MRPPRLLRRSASVVLALVVLGGCGGPDGPDGGSPPVSAENATEGSATGSDTLPEWEAIDTTATPRDDFGTAVVGSEIWILGGMTGERGNRLTSVEVLDTTTGRWRTARTRMPVGLASFESVAIGPRIYSFGGFDTDFKASGYAGYLDTDTGRWHRLPRLPHPRYAHTVTLHEGELWVVGGRDAGGPLDVIDVFDPGTGRWRTADVTMPGPRDSHDTVSTAEGLLVIGGFDEDGMTDRVDLFDPVTGEQRPVPALPQPISRGGAAVVDDRLWFSWHGVSYVLDLAGARTWEPANPLTLSRHGLGYVQVGDHLYAIAGCSESPLRDVRTVDRMPLP